MPKKSAKAIAESVAKSEEPAGPCPVPFQNLGNTCYLNSLLQVMCPIVPLLIDPENASTASEEGATPTLIRLSQMPKTGGGKAAMKEAMVCIREIKRLAAERNDEFSGNDQCDSFEFMSTLTHLIHEELNRGAGGGYKEFTDRKAKETEMGMAARWVRTMRAKDNSCVSDRLCSLAQSTTTCLRCNRRSLNFDPTSAISLDPLVDTTANLDMHSETDGASSKTTAAAPQTKTAQKKAKKEAKRGGSAVGQRPISEDAVDLVRLLSVTYGEREMINGYICEGCSSGGGKEKNSKETTASRAVQLLALPDVLVIQLKRFTWDEKKIKRQINFDEILEIPTSVGEDKEELVEPLGRNEFDSGSGSRYNLVGTVCHHGRSLHSGHYTANVRYQSQWFHCDDDRIRKCDASSVINDSEVYVLVYVREGVTETAQTEGAAAE